MLKDTILCLREISFNFIPIISFYPEDDLNVLEELVLQPLKRLYPKFLNKFHLSPQKGLNESQRFNSAFDFAFKELKLASAIIIGSDTPHLQPKLLELSIEILTRQKTAVLGPSQRGGFYLLGIQQFLHNLGKIFVNSDESINAVELLSKEDIIVHLLPEVSDIDTFNDLLTVRAIIGLLERSPPSLNYYFPRFTNKILNLFNRIIK